MQISSRFTIAVHVLIAIETFKNDHKISKCKSDGNQKTLAAAEEGGDCNSEAGKRRCRYREILDGDNASGCLQCRGACRKWTVVSFP